MNDTDWAYLAGLIDGEGCIQIGQDGQFLVSICNTHEGVIHQWHRLVGGRIDTKHPRGNCRVCYNLVFNGHRAIHILRNSYPYLIIKKLQARVALEAMAVHDALYAPRPTRLGIPPISATSDVVREAMMPYRNMIMGLNQRTLDPEIHHRIIFCLDGNDTILKKIANFFGLHKLRSQISIC